MNMKIGFFDSGIGGLSVLQQAFRMLPQEQFIYYADQKHVPYGEKTQKEIMGYVEEVVQFMLHHDVKAIVIACNTATSVAVRELRKHYSLPIIGMEPAVKKAIDLYQEQRVLVTATPITVKGEKMKILIDKVDKQHLVDLLALPKLVHFAERMEFDSEEVVDYLRQELKHFHLDQYASLVLGCTHFNYFKDSFQKVLPNHIRFVDGIQGTLEQLIRKLKEGNLLEQLQPSVEYYSSGERIIDPFKLKEMDQLLSRLEQMSLIQ